MTRGRNWLLDSLHAESGVGSSVTRAYPIGRQGSEAGCGRGDLKCQHHLAAQSTQEAELLCSELDTLAHGVRIQQADGLGFVCYRKQHKTLWVDTLTKPLGNPRSYVCRSRVLNDQVHALFDRRMEDVGCGYQREATERDRLFYLETEAEARSHGVQARVAHENHCAGETKAAVHRLQHHSQNVVQGEI